LAGKRLLAVMIAAGAMVVGAIAIIAFKPAGMSSMPVSATGSTAATAQPLSDVDTMIAQLESRLKANPNDGEGFRMLGWSYMMTGNPDKALAPYERAMSLIPNDVTVHAGYGEALTGVANGTVTDAAKGQFEQASKLAPNDPRSRYFLSLYKSQHGDANAALDEWIALANSAPSGEPWQADVRRQIAQTSAKLHVDVRGRLKMSAPSAAANSGMNNASAGNIPKLDSAAEQAGNAMPDADRQAMIDGMVTRLADRLKANPNDPDGWARLIHSRMVLGQSDQAKRDLSAARGALAGAPEGLAKVNAAADEAGL
jgi:cytochrome c-type biogenesis protein CcmH